MAKPTVSRARPKPREPKLKPSRTAGSHARMPLKFYFSTIPKAEQTIAKLQRQLDTARALRSKTVPELVRQLAQAQAALRRQVAAVKRHYGVDILTSPPARGSRMRPPQPTTITA